MWLTRLCAQELPYPELPHDEEAQPPHTHPHPRSKRHRAHRLRKIRCVVIRHTLQGAMLTARVADFGKEKKLPLKGLDDKAIEQQVTDLVHSGL